MEDEPTTGVTSARNDTEAPPSQESDDTDGGMPRITFRLPRQIERQIEREVDSGRYPNTSEAVRSAVSDRFEPELEGSA
jgi:hypothetical protein